MQDGFLQRPLADVVVQRRPWLPQKQREPLPVLKQIPHGHTQTGVRFHVPCRELGVEPGAKFFHDRGAVQLVET